MPDTTEIYYILIVEIDSGHSAIFKFDPQSNRKPVPHNISIPFSSYEGISIVYNVLRNLYMNGDTKLFPYTCTQVANMWLDISAP